MTVDVLSQRGDVTLISLGDVTYGYARSLYCIKLSFIKAAPLVATSLTNFEGKNDRNPFKKYSF